MKQILQKELGKEKEQAIVSEFITKQKKKMSLLKLKINSFLILGLIIMVVSLTLFNERGDEISTVALIASLTVSAGLIGNLMSRQMPAERAVRYYIDQTTKLYNEMMDEKITFYNFLQKMEVDFDKKIMIGSKNLLAQFGEDKEEYTVFYSNVEKDFFDIVQKAIDDFKNT